MGDLVAVLAIAAVAGLAGLGLGIFFLAPRLSRLANRTDEEPGAGND
jgi:hypothetical protein